SAISSCPDRASPPPGRAATTRSSASATPMNGKVAPGCDTPADASNKTSPSPRERSVSARSSGARRDLERFFLGLLGPGAAAHLLDLASLALGLDPATPGGVGGRSGASLAVDPQGFGQA